MEAELIPIASDALFGFCCHRSLPCFNACCQDLNQFLTPYDVLRLKNHLGLSSTDFLRRYCSRHTGPESGLPMVTLTPRSSPGAACPFVTGRGCSVYAHRPSSCRTYPLIRAVAKSRETGAVTERFVLIKESHCGGFGRQKEQTVRQWMEDQGLAPYNQFNDLLIEVISLKNRRLPGALDTEAGDLFHLALYDLDRFREHLFDNDRLHDGEFDRALRSDARINDVALLKLGIQWVERKLLKAQPARRQDWKTT